jgi:N-acetylglucosaminyl-diphospho-decaprenol L-rhamnosyltransferase
LISVSIVSHGQGELVSALLADIAALRRDDLRIIVTLNIPEADPGAHGIEAKYIHNPQPKGFGANHNHALAASEDEFFCILNPDIRCSADPFPNLIAALQEPRVAVAGPRVYSASGKLENSARRFPTFASLAAKGLGFAPELDYPESEERLSPDWVAGMFMLARREAFRAVGGFDERYFLYYEDIDLCRRLRQRGLEIRLVPSAKVVHDARKTSHRDLRYLGWHLRSIFRFLTTKYD